MIKLQNVDKSFKKNKIHVINNISLEFENTGLVAILGPSGCGKTTLLNCIGGLDKIKKGKILIKNQKISSKISYKVDKIRNINIGYIFQDYKLIENISVYDNVAIVLKMIGIKDKKEIKKRVEYVLDKVGMLRYKKRPANMLSGGERQRVGIARAIVKDPEIILADEPTGNLDSKNSLEIMKLIKAISKHRLVILVTHEQNLAKFYASRIISLKDGSIIDDYKNDDVKELDYEIDNNFYLKDFKYKNNLKDEKLDIDVYSNTKDKINLDIVIKNGNIYIRSKTKEKIEIVDDNSSIEFIDDHFKKIDKSELEKLEYNFKDIIDKNIKKKYSSILNPFTLIIQGFKRVFDFPILKKILLIGFFISGMFIMYSVSSILSTLNIKDEDFVSINKNYLIVEQNKLSVNDYLDYEKNPSIDYILPGDSQIQFDFKNNDYYQTSKVSLSLSGSLSSTSMINSDDLILGRMPENEYEIVVDKFAIKNELDSSKEFKMVGIIDYKDMLNKTLKLNNMEDFKIVGITDLSSPSIYVDEKLFINILYNTNSIDEVIFDYSLFKDKINIKEGNEPVNDYEIIVNINFKENFPLNKETNLKINDTKLKVVGYYDSKYNYNYYFTNNNTIKYHLIENSKNLVILSNNNEETIEKFRELNINIKNSYDYSKNIYKEQTREQNVNTIIVSGIMLLISLIEMLLMIRSSFLSRIKEIGILRAIGVKKIDIYKMFYGEIFAITTIASLPGLIFMAYILKTISKVSLFGNLFLINPITIIISVVLVYLFNLIIGLIPVFNVVRKTPASILSRHDLD